MTAWEEVGEVVKGEQEEMLRWEDGDGSGGTLEGTGISTDGTPNRCRLSAGIMSGWKQHQCLVKIKTGFARL